ncbi:TlpA family protein disulfide reductase [Mucilaginibacter sp. BJC16-A38]|uniref:TlpA family protein disulfide reductase n=1 Tax=Mucilaginibacter phenanthrenivorans TaxID=1234842 RepID=UPI002157E932|nr:TlpA disulfide reductase family protein [Mucilaginibacter phenanthrenivorans]MCR8559238.1 TlpA family protein disulfide reductase [Mucilaginibacter phenanthrenivorans]
MKPKFQLLTLFCMMALGAGAQNDTSVKAKTAQIDTSLKFTEIQKDSTARVNSVKKEEPLVTRYMGDAAPQLRVKDWIKGKPITNFEKGEVYVIDFWATWCGWCIKGMPHLSELARKYKGKVTFAAVSVWEDRGTRGATPEKLKAFVDGMGDKMDFSVASEDTAFTQRDWLNAFHLDYIPVSFIIDGQGRVAWTGNSAHVDTALQKIVNNTWDIEQESARRKYSDSSQNYLDTLDNSVIAKTKRLQLRSGNENLQGFTDSILVVINDMVKKEPKIKYTPEMASHTFAALLITDPHKACEYATEAMASPYAQYAYGMVIEEINFSLRYLTTPKEVYLLGAECYQVKIDQSEPDEDAAYLAKQYQSMADWYRLGGDKLKAIAADKKALKLWEKDADK